VIEQVILQWLAKELDQRLLRQAGNDSQRDRLEIAVREDVAFVRTRPGSFGTSVGALRLMLLGIIALMAAFFITVTVVWVTVTQPGGRQLGVLVVSFAFVALVVTVGVVALRWSVAAVRETAEISCSRTELRVRQTVNGRHARDFSVNMADVSEVMVVDQFFVLLELLVATKQKRLHRVLSGLRRDELERVAAMITGMKQA
jgi:hypothetical protein